MVAVLRTLAAVVCAIILMASIGCGSSSSSTDGPPSGTMAPQKKGVQQLQMQQNPNFKPKEQGSKVGG